MHNYSIGILLSFKPLCLLSVKSAHMSRATFYTTFCCSLLNEERYKFLVEKNNHTLLRSVVKKRH